jgi:hypothetical protein
MVDVLPLIDFCSKVSVSGNLTGCTNHNAIVGRGCDGCGDGSLVRVLMDWSLYYIQLNATVTWLIEVAALVHLVFFFLFNTWQFCLGGRL